MRMIEYRIRKTALILFCLSALSGCGGWITSEKSENAADDAGSSLEETAGISVEIQETAFEKNEHYEVSAKAGRDMDDSVAELLQKMPKEENGILEIYADSNAITVDKMMTAQISPEEILKGNLILYDRFRIDGWVFEWLISDYHDEGDWSMEDGVLLVSRKGNAEDAQIIHVTAEGGYGTWVLAKNKFKYVDVNFDGIPDLLICTGSHGNQMLQTYYCFLQTENGFVEAPTFTDISNPAIDVENQLILSQWRNWAASHSWAEYKCQNDTYVRYRELCEEADLSGDKEVWVWTINGEEIARSDKISEEEIAEFLYGENSEWKLADDRWRTLYNNGLTVDYSIYAEP